MNKKENVVLTVETLTSFEKAVILKEFCENYPQHGLDFSKFAVDDEDMFPLEYEMEEEAADVEIKLEGDFDRRQIEAFYRGELDFSLDVHRISSYLS